MDGHRRMFEEYLYKESVSLTYEYLKSEIEKVSEYEEACDLQLALLKQSLEVPKKNPSSHLDKIDGELLLNSLSSVLNIKSVKMNIGGLVSSPKFEIETLQKYIKEKISQTDSKDEDDAPA